MQQQQQYQPPPQNQNQNQNRPQPQYQPQYQPRLPYQPQYQPQEQKQPRKIRKYWYLGYIIPMVMQFFFYLLVLASSDDIIISQGIRFLNFIKIYLPFTGVLIATAGITSGFVKYRRFKARLKTHAIIENADIKIEKDIGKEELIKKLSELKVLFAKCAAMDNHMKTEYQHSLEYLDVILGHFTKIDDCVKTLNTLNSNQQTGALYEVFNTYKLSEEQLIKNTTLIMNHINLELVIDGYDKTNIDRYIGINENIVAGCQSLLKTSLLFLDDKCNETGVLDSIDTLIDILNKLKGEKMQ